MSSPQSHSFLLIGLPSTGKTTFLAALWYAIQQRQSPTALVLKKLDGESKYLNEIRDAWLAYKPVGRTQFDTEKFVSMWLKRSDSDEEVHLTFPDVSGESFKQQWVSRQITVSYDKCLRSANGGILFIHPNSVTLPLRIAEVDDLASLIDDAVAEEVASSPTAAPPSTPWDKEKSPTQVQLVELLQFLIRRPHFKPPFRFAIAISAWDLVAASNVSPEDWIAKQLPLFSQFLSSNRKLFEATFYGVSAQGGEYQADDVVALQSKNPARRIEVVGKSIKNRHDITEPLLWLMR